jgi:hypothetical protein
MLLRNKTVMWSVLERVLKLPEPPGTPLGGLASGEQDFGIKFEEPEASAYGSQFISAFQNFFLGLLLVLLGQALATAQGFRYLEVKVVDADDKPMADVNVDIDVGGMAFPMPTDEEGIVSFNVPDKGRTKVTIKHDGYLAQGVAWNDGETVPDTFTFPMKKGVPIGGIVHDEQGQPIEGVKIEGIMIVDGTSDLPGGGKVVPYIGGELATTDKEGKWKLNSAPEEKAELQLRFTHPQYVGDRGYSYRGGTWDELRSQEKIVVMEKGISVAGTVTDPDGKPVANAKVGLGSDYIQSDMLATTDAQGKYFLSNMNPGLNILTVFSNNFAPQMRQVSVSKEMKPEDFQLKPGKPVTFYVTDPDGKPVPDVDIAADTWQGCRALMNLATRGRTDTDGKWTWQHAPDEPVRSDLFRRGWMSVRNREFGPQAEPHEITMNEAIKVTGKVVDAVTGVPVPKFSAIQGMKWDNSNQPVYWERYNTSEGTDGSFTMEFDEPREGGHLVRIEAAGYRPVISREFKDSEGSVELEFKLEKGVGPTGVVKNPDGSPAEGVQVVMSTVGNQQAYIRNGLEDDQDTISTKTDAEGKFELPYPETDFLLICIGKEGWVQIEGTSESKPFELSLQPWAVVEGKFVRGDQPIGNQEIRLYFQDPYVQDRPRAYWHYNATSDADGNFRFERVRAGEANVGREMKYAEAQSSWMNTTTHSTNVTLEPGETAKIVLGGEGRTVTGTLTAPKSYTEPVAWQMGAIQMMPRVVAPQQSPAGFFEAIGRAIAGSSSPRPVLQPQPPRPEGPQNNYGSVIDSNGKFEFFAVKPGTYQLNLQMYGLRANERDYNNRITLNVPVTVPEGENDEPVDVGSFEITIPEQKSAVPQPTATFQLIPAAQ